MIDFRWFLAFEAAMWPEMIIAKAEEFQIIVAEGQFLVHRLEQSFHFAVGGWAMHLRPDVLNPLSLAPAIKPTP